MLTSSSNLDRKKIIILLTVIILVGAFLRLFGLGRQSLWYDELLNWHRSSQKDLSLLSHSIVRNDGHPPGYYLLLHFVIRYFGDTEVILRLPSVIFGVLSVLVIFLLGQLLYSYREGLIASCLMAFFYTPIYFSQEARPYALLLLLSLLSVYYWIRILGHFKKEKDIPLSNFILYILTAALCSYTHYFGLYFIVLQGIALLTLLVTKPKAFKIVFFIYLSILMFYLPWLPGIKEHLVSQRLALNNWMRKPIGLTFNFNNYFFFIFNNSLVLSSLAYLLFAFLFFQGLIQNSKIKHGKNVKAIYWHSNLILILWIIIPFIGAYLVSVFWKPVLSSRNLIISLPAFYLLFSRSLMQIPGRARYKAIVTISIIIFALSHLIFHRSYYSSFYKERFREATKFVTDNYEYYRNSRVIVWGAPRSCFKYYFQKSGLPTKIKLTEGPWRPLVNPLNSLFIFLDNYDYIWYLRVHLKEMDHDLDFLNFLQNNLTVIKHKKFSNTEEVWLFKRKDNPANTKLFLVNYIKRYLNNKNKVNINNANLAKVTNLLNEIFGPPLMPLEIENIKSLFSEDVFDEIKYAISVFKSDFNDTTMVILLLPSKKINYTLLKIIYLPK
ncbi:MAG: glycosyltransferase family 39 protein [Candidatus Omnitrophica bacterium]|jgi:hypothetical protein|nr:glycosyltransferase family 39 protein [Candidatus Omnitrophota bacterium]